LEDGPSEEEDDEEVSGAPNFADPSAKVTMREARKLYYTHKKK